MPKHADRNKNLCTVPDTMDADQGMCVIPQTRGNSAAQDALRNGEEPWVEPEWSRNLGPGDVHPHVYHGEPLPENAAEPRRRVAGGEFSHIDVGDGGIDIAPVDISAEGGNVRAEGPVAEGSLGQINDRETTDDPAAYGARGRVSLGGVRIGEEDGTHVRLNTPYAEGQVSFSPDEGITCEGGAGLLEAEGQWRMEDLADTRVQFGLRGGMEEGWHTMNEDTDGDGYNEQGFHFDAGIASIGVNTELFSRGWSSLFD